MPNSSMELSHWIDRVDALASKVRAAKVQAEEDCRLPESLLDELAAAGLFRMWLPSELGGHDVEPATACRVIEAVARIDGSTGWCIGPGNVSSLFAAFLPEDAAHHVYGGEWAVNAAGSLAGMGAAVPVEGGFRLSPDSPDRLPI